jgi:hypothetical protein
LSAGFFLRGDQTFEEFARNFGILPHSPWLCGMLFAYLARMPAFIAIGQAFPEKPGAGRQRCAKIYP